MRGGEQMAELAVSGSIRMTTREVAEAQECDVHTVTNHANKLFPDKIRNGVKTYFDEKEVTLILESIKQTKGDGARAVTLETRLQGTETALTPVLKIVEREGWQAVNARDLHTALEVGRDFSNRVKDRIGKYGFVEGGDFTTCSPNLASENHGGQNKIDYLLSVAMAKEIAMVENNERGRAIRQYLIKVEKAWNSPQMIMARALQFSQKQIEGYRQEIAVLKPKAETLDKITAGKGDVSVRELASILAVPHLGQNNLFQKLRDDGYIDGYNRPYRRYVESGLMYEKEYYVPGLDATKRQLRITQKGVAYFANKYAPSKTA
jgi:anti-repressor protein